MLFFRVKIYITIIANMRDVWISDAIVDLKRPYLVSSDNVRWLSYRRVFRKKGTRGKHVLQGRTRTESSAKPKPHTCDIICFYRQ